MWGRLFLLALIPLSLCYTQRKSGHSEMTLQEDWIENKIDPWMPSQTEEPHVDSADELKKLQYKADSSPSESAEEENSLDRERFQNKADSLPLEPSEEENSLARERLHYEADSSPSESAEDGNTNAKESSEEDTFLQAVGQKRPFSLNERFFGSPKENSESDTPVTSDSEPAVENGQFKVVCYFTNWAWYRPGAGKYLPTDIDAGLCTHIIYAFATLDGNELVIKAYDSWADLDNKFYEKVAALKKSGVKVLLAIGGWNDSAGNKYSKLVNNAAARTKFVKHAVEFLKKYNFQGLDLDWEYPKCWQGNCQQGPASDKEGFAKFVTELSAAFKPHGLLLSAAVSASHTVIDSGYDVALLSQKLDWINLMTYDYHGQWEKTTGHVAPMYARPDDSDKTWNCDYSVKYWMKKGAAKDKIVMGMPMYGHSFTLADKTKNGLNAPTYGGGEAGEFTRARGTLSYYEICERVKKGWKVVQDPSGKTGPYAYSGNQWVGYDDQAMIKRKSQYVRDNKLGGAMIWALDLDDFRNVCGGGKYTLLRTINQVLRH